MADKKNIKKNNINPIIIKEQIDQEKDADEELDQNNDIVDEIEIDDEEEEQNSDEIDELDEEDTNEVDAEGAEDEESEEAYDDNIDDNDKNDKNDKKNLDDEEVDNCLYNYANNDSDNEIEVIFDDDIDTGITDTMKILPPDARITKPFLFKYERVRIIGDRTQQLTLGAKPMIKNIDERLTQKEIAELELENNVIPLIIERPLPNGKKERWYTSELKH